MKKVRLTYDCIKVDGNNYSVLVGDYDNNDCLKYRQFSSKKEAENFIKKTNKFLTDAIHEVNMLYARVHYEYRINWAIISDTSADKQKERYINGRLDFVRDNLNIIISTSNAGVKYVGINTFKLLTISCDYLSSIVDILLQYNQKRSQTNMVYAYKFLLNDVLTLQARINNYSQKTNLYISKLPEKKQIKILTKTIINASNNTQKRTAKARKSLSQRKTNHYRTNADFARVE